MIRTPPALAQAGLNARMLLQMHDELVFEAREDEAEKSAAVVKEVMEAACAPVLRLSVPLVVETGRRTIGMMRIRGECEQITLSRRYVSVYLQICEDCQSPSNLAHCIRIL